MRQLNAEEAAPKPDINSLLKPRSVKRVEEEYDVISNSEWDGEDDNDFAFVNATLIRAPLTFAGPRLTDFKLYPKVVSAIQKMEYDPRTRLLEVQGESHGLTMHSWIRVDQPSPDVVHYTIVRGNMVGFKINAFLYEYQSKTVAVANGTWPQAKQMLPSLVRLVFKPVSEIVLSVATKSFRGYIEEEYKNKKAGN